MKRAVATIILLSFSAVASAGWFGPSNYDECVLENMKGVGSDLAARTIGAICYKKFPPKVEAKKAEPPPSPCPADRNAFHPSNCIPVKN